MSDHVEYLGFEAGDSVREYTMRVRGVGDDSEREFIVVITNDAFLKHRVRYQDAPEICFAKLQKELALCEEGESPARRLKISEAELAEYRSAHTPKSPLSSLDNRR